MSVTAILSLLMHMRAVVNITFLPIATQAALCKFYTALSVFQRKLVIRLLLRSPFNNSAYSLTALIFHQNVASYENALLEAMY